MKTSTLSLLIWCFLNNATEAKKQANGAVLLDVVKLGPPTIITSPDYPANVPPQAQREWRSDADPNGDAEKTFQLKVEKTKAKATNYKPMQFSGAKHKVKIRSVNGPGPGGRGGGRGPPGRGPPGRGGPPRGGGGRGGPPDMTSQLNPELASQLARAQGQANQNDANFNPGHNPGDMQPGMAPEYNPPRKPMRKPQLKSASLTSNEDTSYSNSWQETQERMAKMEAERIAEEEAAAKAQASFRKGLILPCFLLVVGLGILGWLVQNKKKVDEEKARKEAEASANSRPEPELPVPVQQISVDDSVTPKSPEDRKKIEDVYKEKPLAPVKEGRESEDEAPVI